MVCFYFDIPESNPRQVVFLRCEDICDIELLCFPFNGGRPQSVDLRLLP